jgi:hypothetical protein
MNRVCLSLLLAGAAFAQSKPVNPGFEQGDLDSVPAGWFVPPVVASAGFGAKSVDQNCRTGSRCAMLTGTANPPANSFGNLMQSLPAAESTACGASPECRDSAGVRVPLQRAGERLDRADNSMAFLENMGTRPVTSSEWKTYDITTAVPEDVSLIVVGVMLFGAGNAWVDDVDLEILDEIHKDKTEPARPLTPQGLTNLTAFARALRVCPLLPPERSGRPYRLGELRHRRCTRRGRRGLPQPPPGATGKAVSASRANSPDLSFRTSPRAGPTSESRRDDSLPPQRRRTARHHYFV